MAQIDVGILEAIDIAMEAEMKAQQFYADAAKRVINVRGRNLLEQLADFEQNHYNKLKTLKDALTSSGEYIKYEGTEFKPFKAEVTGTLESDKAGVLDVLKIAIDAETKAKDHYTKMAEATNDPEGKAMFEKLADEEDFHRRILNDEFYNLSNEGGTWTWGD